MNRNSLKFGIMFIILFVSMFLINSFPISAQIAFESTRDGSSVDPVYDEIYIMNNDGSGLTRLTDSIGYDGVPSCSLDGNKITFESWRDGNKEIYIMNADGTNQINLTNNIAVDEAPSFSPDGTKIAFDSNRSGQFEIWVVNRDGTGLTQLTTNGGNYEPAWSFDGTKITYESNHDIYVMNSDGSNPIQLTDNLADDGWPAWSPDGSKIAFVSDRDGNREIYLMNADGSEQINLTQSTNNDWYPSWSLDGTKIIFQSYRDGNYELYEMNIDGSRQTRYTVNNAYDEAPVFLQSNALNFDGVNDYVQPPNAINSTIQGSFTLAAKVYLGTSDCFMLIQRGNGVTGGQYYGFDIYVRKNSVSIVRNINSTTNYGHSISGDFSILETMPAYIFLTYDKMTGEVRVYLNDQYIGNATTSKATIVYNWDKGFNIGAMRRTAGGELYYQATLYKWSLWNGVCTEAELTAIRNSNYSLVEKNPAVIYEFNEGSGNTLADTSGNGYNGTIYGATWIVDSLE